MEVRAEKNARLDRNVTFLRLCVVGRRFVESVHSKIKVDDEDDNDANSWKWYNASEEVRTRIQNIVSGGSNTIYHVVRWVKMTLAMLLEAK